jgi:hypothetical protein
MANKLSTVLKNKARYWAGEMTKLAKSFAPNHLKDNISSKSEERGNGTFIIRTIASAPDARAQEFGSGLRARRGPKQKYPIRPKGGHPFLAFYWDVATQNPENFRMHEDGRVLLPQVMHPGIAPVNNGKGYIRPAQIELRKRIKKELNQEVPNAIRAELRASFKK